MLLATLILDREPMQWVGFPRALMDWIQNAGAVAAIAALLWVAASATSRREKARLTATYLALGALALSWLGFVAVGILSVGNWLNGGAWRHLMPTTVPPTTAADFRPLPPPPT